MKASSIAIRRPAGLGLLGLALVLGSQPARPRRRAAGAGGQCQARRHAHHADHRPGTTSALFGAGHHPAPDRAQHHRRRPPTPPATPSPSPPAGSTPRPSPAPSVTPAASCSRSVTAWAWKALSLAKFTIHVTGAPNLSAVVNGGQRLAIADLDLGNAADQEVRQGRPHLSSASRTSASPSTRPPWAPSTPPSAPRSRTASSSGPPTCSPAWRADSPLRHQLAACERGGRPSRKGLPPLFARDAGTLEPRVEPPARCLPQPPC